MDQDKNDISLDLENALRDLDIDELEISNFIEESRLEESESLAKVMSASCTTCECCCSCCCS